MTAVDCCEANRYYFVDGWGRIRAVSYDAPRDDRARGRCSGIPKCCIDYFIGEWQTSEDDSPVEWGYVPCPECVATGMRIAVRNCSARRCTCGTWDASVVVGYTSGFWLRVVALMITAAGTILVLL